jgi:hypothetical protein
LQVGRTKLPLFQDAALSEVMSNFLAILDKQADDEARDGGFEFGFDYVVSAVKPETM